MSEMIERVARAMKPPMAKLVDRLIEMGADRDEAVKLLPLAEARAAIEAMREPTLEMRQVSKFEAAEVDWPDMIDAALSIPKPKETP